MKSEVAEPVFGSAPKLAKLNQGSVHSSAAVASTSDARRSSTTTVSTGDTPSASNIIGTLEEATMRRCDGTVLTIIQKSTAIMQKNRIAAAYPCEIRVKGHAHDDLGKQPLQGAPIPINDWYYIDALSGFDRATAPARVADVISKAVRA